MLLDIGNSAPEVVEAFADELGEDGASGVMFKDGVDNMCLERGVGVDSEVFGKE